MNGLGVVNSKSGKNRDNGQQRQLSDTYGWLATDKLVISNLLAVEAVFEMQTSLMNMSKRSSAGTFLADTPAV